MLFLQGYKLYTVANLVIYEVKFHSTYTRDVTKPGKPTLTKYNNVNSIKGFNADEYVDVGLRD
jgi:hypothetical protein